MKRRRKLSMDLLPGVCATGALVLMSGVGQTARAEPHPAAGNTGGEAAAAADIHLTRAPYGAMRDGRAVEQYRLQNAHGVTLTFITYGGLITSLSVPDRNGRPANIVLGFSSLADYEAHNGDIHFGALIGRYANRIARGRFTLDGRQYQLPINDPPNTLHSGPNNFDTKLWTAREIRLDGQPAVELTYVSPAGENGFPGTLTTHVTYALTPDDRVRILFRATTDAPTVVNLTSHTYFNLAGEAAGAINDHVISIAASRYTPTDSGQIPTGELRSVTGTPFDLRTPTPMGRNLRSNDPQMVMSNGYDKNWVIDGGGQDRLVPAARVSEPTSGRVMDVFTTQPGLQFYTANGLNGGVVGASGRTYRQGDGFALEAEHFPNASNQPDFPTTVLRPGQQYAQETVWKFSVQ